MKKARTKIVLSAVLFALAATCNSAVVSGKPLKVLMIGNSFSLSCMTYIHDVAQSTGCNLDICSMYIGGCSMERHVENIASSRPGFAPYAIKRTVPFGKKKANIPDMLVADDWDVVVIQQASGLSWRPETYHPCGESLVATIRELAPRAEIVVQETWSYTPWDRRLAEWGVTADEMYEKLHAAYAAFAGCHGFRTIPMGMAVQEWRSRLPVRYAENSFGGDVVGGRNKPPSEQFVERDGNWEPNSDVFHLNKDGEYLQALVWTAFLFDVDVTKCTFVPPDVPCEKANLMKSIAMDVVTPSKFRSHGITGAANMPMEGIAYSDRKECILDISVPAASTGFPTVVWFHGGGLDKNAGTVTRLTSSSTACVRGCTTSASSERPLRRRSAAYSARSGRGAETCGKDASKAR